eukprot:4993762-Pyramimonas_sp.AAC.1
MANNFGADITYGTHVSMQNIFSFGSIGCAWRICRRTTQCRYLEGTGSSRYTPQLDNIIKNE